MINFSFKGFLRLLLRVIFFVFSAAPSDSILGRLQRLSEKGEPVRCFSGDCAENVWNEA